jgi:LPXTG-motif cell wall-anchored protein
MKRREVVLVGLVSVGSLIARKLLILALVMSLALGWSAAANAQTSFEGQYGDPMASGQQAVESPGAASGTAIESSGAASETGSAAVAGVLPDTGGSMFFFFTLGVLALGSTGLLMLRHNSRR